MITFWAHEVMSEHVFNCVSLFTSVDNYLPPIHKIISFLAVNLQLHCFGLHMFAWKNSQSFTIRFPDMYCRQLEYLHMQIIFHAVYCTRKGESMSFFLQPTYVQ